jgi:hypothetical protein
MTAEQAMSFVREHGVVLASAKGPVARLAEVVTGESIKGSWWAHAKSHQIFAILQHVGESPDILVCRLVNGKVTLVHRRLWPALVRVAHRFQSNQLAQVRQEHTARGNHVSREVPFPDWVPPEIMEEARRLAEQQALSALGRWTTLPDKPPTRTSRRKRRPGA